MNLLPDLCLAPTCIHQFIPGRFYYLIFFKNLFLLIYLLYVFMYVCMYLNACIINSEIHYNVVQHVMYDEFFEYVLVSMTLTTKKIQM